ncbi:MAG: S9 family peptidase [Vulcanimicrobiaceae bacterium]
MTRTPLVPSDLSRFALPNDPNIAPDGRVYYVVATPNEEKNETTTTIWTVRAGRPATRFTSGERDRMPRVSPDGAHLAFVGDRGTGKRIYLVPLGGGEARELGPAYDAIGALVWSPDGQKLAYVATAPHDAASARIAHDEKTGARHIRALPFKSDDDGLLDGRRKHLFTLEPFDGRDPIRVTYGDFDVAMPAWSPDGASLAFAAQIDAREDAFYTDIFVVTLATGSVVKRTRSRGPSTYPSFSHDGTHLAYIGHEHGDDAGGRFNEELLVMPASGGEPISLSAHVDRSVTDGVICDIRGSGGSQAPIWSANDEELFVPLADSGSCAIAAFARDGGAHREVVGGERDIYAFTRNPDGAFAFVYSTPTVPSEIASFGPTREETQLTTCNAWLFERTIRAPRRVRPRASDGQQLDLWILDPDPAKDTESQSGEARHAPYVLQVHGGPHAAYGHAFMIEFQILAAHGIGVAYGNPRGSQTYGHAYADAITGDWGGIDAADVLSLLDGALASASIDAARVGLAGGSYGGFTTKRLLGRSKCFAAGVSMRAVNDRVSEVGATDLGWFIEREVASPWTADAGLKLFLGSPMRRAHEIDVPLLVEHSERDFRCAIDQGEGLFTLLRRLGRTQTEFVRFAGDGHGMSRTGNPRNRILRLRAIAHWFVRHLAPAGIVAVPDTAGALFQPLPTEVAPAAPLPA